jgi:hypothetical protein
MRRTYKQVGTEAETAVVRYLWKWWPNASRLAPAGSADIGDVGGIPGLTIQVKAHHKMDLGNWLNQTAEQSARAQTAHYALVHKRHGKGSPGDWYVTLPLKQFVPIYQAAIVGRARPFA